MKISQLIAKDQVFIRETQIVELGDGLFSVSTGCGDWTKAYTCLSTARLAGEEEKKLPNYNPKKPEEAYIPIRYPDGRKSYRIFPSLEFELPDTCRVKREGEWMS